MRNETDYLALIKKVHRALRKAAIRQRPGGRGFCFCCGTAWRKYESHTQDCAVRADLIEHTKIEMRARWAKQQREYRKRKKSSNVKSPAEQS